MATASKESTGFAKKLDTYFSVSERGSSFGQEVRGGLTTFFTMAYIVVLNPLILGFVKDRNGNFLGGDSTNGKNLAVIAAGTALVAGVMTVMMGAWARFPLAVAAGLGINSVVAYGLVANMGLTWPEAMGFIVLEGVLVLILVLTKLRQKLLVAVPLALKKAIAAGIGLFLAFIALWDARVVTDPSPAGVKGVGPGDPTPSTFGIDGAISTWPTFVFVIGLLFAAFLYIRKVRGAFLIAIIGTTVLAFLVEAIAKLGGYGGGLGNPKGWALNVPTFSGKDLIAAPNFGTLGHVSFSGFAHLGILSGILLAFSLFMIDFFDTMGTMTAVGEEAGLNDDEGIPDHSQEILIVDSVAAIAGGLGGVSSNTAYIESASGVGDGARTGLSSIVTGAAFLIAIFLAPLTSLVPFEAATPVLLLVGLLMLTSVVDIDWRDWRIAVPAFLTIIVMPFGYSISAGIGLGLISYAVLHAATGKAKEVKPLMWAAAGLFGVYFAQDLITYLIHH
jgi:AGZA family xanthine/uracil permease-like MFS transporter